MTGTFMTADEVSEMLGISRGAVYDLAAPKGPLACMRYGRRCIRFNQEDVQAHIEACRHTQIALPVFGTVSIRNVKITVSEPLNCFQRNGIKGEARADASRLAVYQRRRP